MNCASNNTLNNGSVPSPSSPQAQASSSLPSHNNRYVAGLERKYCEALGEIKKLQEAEYEWAGREGFELAEKYYWNRLNSLRATLDSLEKSIRMFDPLWNRKRHLAPRVVKNTKALLPRGKLGQAVIRVLRNTSEGLLVKEIVERAATDLGLSLNRRDQRQRLWSMAYSALRSFHSKGRVAFAGEPARWFAVARTSTSPS